MLALLVQTLVFGVGVALLRRADVAPPAWAGLYLCTAAATLTAPRWAPPGARVWLAVAACGLLLGAMFWGANFGLDALHGAHRHKADVAQYLGGLEVWAVLCPGVVSLALGAAARAWWATPAHCFTRATLAPSKDRP